MKPKPSPTLRQEPLNSFSLTTQEEWRALRKRFASAILSCDSRELRQIFCEIATVSAPSDAPDKFFRVMADALIRTARYARRQHMTQEKLRNLALTDDLTGLHNRRGFFVLASQQLKLARRNRQGALLFFADIDGMKQINDRLGHSEGDIAIRGVARILKDTFRDSDIVARLGGDEFAILANDASAVSQKDIWRRLKENMRVEGSRNSRYSLSVSIGVARFDPWKTINLTELIEHADRAMYQAKKSCAGSRLPRVPERQITPRIRLKRTAAGNTPRPGSASGVSMIRLTPKSSSPTGAGITLEFANLSGRTRIGVGA
jgi:diguanylate cyclase (GGDEF)-like protein